MSQKRYIMSKPEKISIQIHPRAFAAFGEDLVTSDSVAVTELVKNCYDAFALNVTITFGSENGKAYIQIEDDGLGMNEEIIKTAWAMVATPYKKKHPIVERYLKISNQNKVEKRFRRVTGNKGLGRFSAARLGSKLYMLSKNLTDNCVEANFDWDELTNVENLNQCYMTILKHADNPFIKNEDQTGTIIKISGLKSTWNEDKIIALKDELSRLISPFEHVDDFNIKIVSEYSDEPVEIVPPPFINNPIYHIDGSVDELGTVTWNYQYKNHLEKRNGKGKTEWKPTENYYEQLTLLPNNKDKNKYLCGPFTFEIRAWDLDSDSIADVANTFDIKKSEVRKSISLYKGLSVYRDKVLVLPKSEASRDWLGLDARRISDIGRRISTSQIVGIINITAESNPEIKDTTDREKLIDTIEYKQFVQIVNDIIDKLQMERLKDKVENQKRGNLKDLLSPLSSKELLQKAKSAIKKGQAASTIVKYIQDYDMENEKNLYELNSRLTYYAQTASLGSIAIVILHEFLTGMNSIKRFLNRCVRYTDNFDVKTKDYLNDAFIGHKRITEVANSFSPLYRKDLRKQKNICDFSNIVNKSIRLIQSKKISNNVKFISDIPEDIKVKMHEGELQTIFINLFDNACYWLQESKKAEKKVVIKVEQYSEGRISVSVSDNGIGVLEEEANKIFNPGITSKPHGIGMGLVIVAELLSYYDGKIGVRIPGDLDGATFVFDIPLERENAN